MTLRSPRARRLPAGVVRAAALVAVLLLGAACSGGDDVGGDPVPTLLTAPAQTTTSTSSTSSTSTTLATGDTGSSTTAPPSTTASSSSTTSSSTTADAGAPSGPGSAPTTAPTASSSSSVAGTTPTTAVTSTTADIEPPPPSLASTVPIPTAPRPPDTTGGGEVDYLLAPKAIAGLQFGASQATVLQRMRTLLGDPLRVDTLADCPGGPATALQWFNVSLIVTDRGLAYYTVGMSFDDYGVEAIPGWHTAAGLEVGANRAALDAAYPLQITYGAPADSFTPFTVAAGGDAGLAGRLEGDVVDTVTAGTTTC